MMIRKSKTGAFTAGVVFVLQILPHPFLSIPFFANQVIAVEELTQPLSLIHSPHKHDRLF